MSLQVACHTLVEEQLLHYPEIWNYSFLACNKVKSQILFLLASVWSQPAGKKWKQLPTVEMNECCFWTVQGPLLRGATLYNDWGTVFTPPELLLSSGCSSVGASFLSFLLQQPLPKFSKYFVVIS